MRLAIVASHPIQYYAPLYRELAHRCELTVFFAHRATQSDQAEAGFGVGFEWDVDLLSGYQHVFLRNVAAKPGLDRFAGCDTPEIAVRLRGGVFDAVLVQGWNLKAYGQAIWAAKRLGLPVLVRGDSQLRSPRSGFKRAVKAVAYPPLLRLFDAALYVGERSREYWRRYSYPTARLFFSPHCVDADWFAARATLQARSELRSRLGIDPDARVALFAGKLVPFKRPLDLITAAAILSARAHDVEVIIAGAGPLEADIATAAQMKNVRAHFLGFCNQTAMPAAYAASDALVLPSDGNETWGLVANESLACGRPIVLSDAVGSAPDLAGDDTAGRIFPCGDTNALADALDGVLNSSPTLRAIATKSRAFGLTAGADGIETALGRIRPTRRLRWSGHLN